jgi:hypothetical protein
MKGHIRAAAALILVVAVGAPAASAAPPENDNYLAATALNAAGSEMPRDTVTYPATDTSEATLQGDLLSPPSAGGPPEPTACGATPLDRTVWYRFYPDVDGRVKLQAVGFDTTLALVPFTSVASPLPQGYTCANLRDDTIESLEEPVEAGTGYAVQTGGAAGAAGILQISFTFLPDRDRDGVTDEEDRCPRRPGTANGCPPKIIAGIAYKYDAAANGARFRYLDVRGGTRGRPRRLTMQPRLPPPAPEGPLSGHACEGIPRPVHAGRSEDRGPDHQAWPHRRLPRVHGQRRRREDHRRLPATGIDRAEAVMHVKARRP